MKLLVLVSAMAVLSAQAQDVAQGKTKYTTNCVVCHGAQGQGVVGPKLSGQKSEVIVKKLTAYKNKQQAGTQSQIMWGIAGGLTPIDINNLAAYTASLNDKN